LELFRQDPLKNTGHGQQHAHGQFINSAVPWTP
jgi:hypothetical protein